jgi:hypothetical protein
VKVFISHSSLDKWIARRIAADLADLGIETFLDEKVGVTRFDGHPLSGV